MDKLEEAEAEYFAALVDWGAAVKKYLERFSVEVEQK